MKTNQEGEIEQHDENRSMSSSDCGSAEYRAVIEVVKRVTDRWTGASGMTATEIESHYIYQASKIMRGEAAIKMVRGSEVIVPVGNE